MSPSWLPKLPPELWPWLLIGGGAIALGVILLLITLLLRQRDPSQRRTSHVTPAQQRTLERDVSNLITALSEMAQEVGTRLDERAVRLEKLIRAADERVRRLEELSEFHDPPSPQRTATPVMFAQQPLPPAPEPDGRHADIYALADQGIPPVEIARRLSRPKGEVELILALRPRRAG